MRLKAEIDDLTPDQWEQAQKILKTSYNIPENASRACITLVHGQEERHVEAPVSALISLLWGLSLGPAFKALGETTRASMRHMRERFNPVAVAALSPDDNRLPGDGQCSPECQAQDDDRPHLLDCPTRRDT
jgi:hypothetical protein